MCYSDVFEDDSDEKPIIRDTYKWYDGEWIPEDDYNRIMREKQLKQKQVQAINSYFFITERRNP